MKPSTDTYRQARAAVVRRLIRDGVLDPYEGLWLVIRPSAAVLAAERSSPFSTVWDKASGRRENAA